MLNTANVGLYNIGSRSWLACIAVLIAIAYTIYHFCRSRRRWVNEQRDLQVVTMYT